jgi:ribosomal protein S20
VFIATVLFSNFVFGANPNKKDHTKNISEKMVRQLCKDVFLNDSQKLAIQTIAKDYETKLKNKNLQSNEESKKAMNKQIVLEYRSKLNNILTKEQIDSINIKRIQKSKFATNY